MTRKLWSATLTALLLVAMFFVATSGVAANILQQIEEILHGKFEDDQGEVVTPSQQASAADTAQAGANRGTKAANAAQQHAIANNLGWRLGTEWTVRIEEYAEYLVEPDWITTSYRFTVVGADPTTNTFTVSMRFADPSIQPEAAQGDLLLAQYTVNNGNPALVALQPNGQGPAIRADQAQELLGNNFLSLEVPANPFMGGRSVTAEAPGLGRVAAHEVLVGPNTSAIFAQGVPWWVSYTRGEQLRAQLTSFTP